MKSIKNFKSKSNKLKLFIAIFFSVLMLASIFGVLATNDNSSSNLNNVSHDSTNVPTGCSSSVSVGTSYYTNNSIANSTTSTITLPVIENSTATSSYVDDGMSFSSNEASSSGTLINGYYWNGTTISFQLSIPAIYYIYKTDLISGYTVGTVSVTVTAPNSDTASWSHVFNSNDFDPGTSETTSAWVIVSPSFSFSNSMGGTFSISVTETNDGDDGDNGGVYSLNSGNLISDGNGGTNTITTSEPSLASSNLIYGWHYNAATSTITIPAYETYYEISWSSDAASSNISYNSGYERGDSGVFKGNLTANTISINTGDPDLFSDSSTNYTFSYYLSSQYQVSSASTTQTTSASYSYSQLYSNEMDASYSFSVGTPSSATFAPYESSTNSLTTSTPTVTFSPDETVDNPYYSYAQNDLVINVSNAVTYSSSSSNSQSATFDITSSSYSSATSPTWDVNLYLYGNSAPVYQNASVSLATVNPLTPVTLYAN